jgi:hypothetical protein
MKHIPKSTLETAHLLVPKIWADGEHDDLAGLVAAIRNEVVEYEGELYEPDTPICLWGQHLRISKGLWIVGEGGHLPEDDGNAWVVVHAPNDGRHIRIERCHIQCDADRPIVQAG